MRVEPEQRPVLSKAFHDTPSGHVNTTVLVGQPRPDRKSANALLCLRRRCQWKLDKDGSLLGLHRAICGFKPGWTPVCSCKFGRPGGAVRRSEGIDWAWLSMDGAMTKSAFGWGKKLGKPTDPARQA